MSNLEFDKEQEQEQNQQYGSKLELTEPEEPKTPAIDGKDDEIEAPEDQQLALFDVPENKKKPSAKKKSTPKKVSPQEKVGTEYTVYYAGHKVPIPEEEMTLEQVRSFLEADFPELSKDRAELLLDKENKHVVPVVKGAKKG